VHEIKVTEGKDIESAKEPREHFSVWKILISSGAEKKFFITDNRKRRGKGIKRNSKSNQATLFPPDQKIHTKTSSNLITYVN
jgi:hypothetical protein